MAMRTLRALWDPRDLQRQVKKEVLRKADRPVFERRGQALQRRGPAPPRRRVRPIAPPRRMPTPRRPRASNVSASNSGFERESTSLARFNEIYLGSRYMRMCGDA